MNILLEGLASVQQGLRATPMRWLLQAAMAAVFLYSGQDKLRHRKAALQEISTAGLPWPGLLLAATVATQLIGGLAMLSNWPVAVALGALLLAGFTLIASLLFHRFWLARGAIRQQQLTGFLEHMLMVAGLLLLAVQQNIGTL